jgi:putative methyltransferase (TIGR04325 family)
MADLTQDDLEPVNSWSDARILSKGYQDEALVRNLTAQFKHDLPLRVANNKVKVPVSEQFSVRRMHLLMGFFISARRKSSMRVADIGGGNGYMFDWVSQSNSGLDLDWTVYESEAIATNYKASGIGLEIDFSQLVNFSQNQIFDLSIISCSLQYLEDWEEILRIAGENSKHILIMRTPLAPIPAHKFFIQKNDTGIYGASQSSWPFTMFSKDLFERKLASLGKIIISASDYEETFPYDGNFYPMSTLLVKCN